MALADLLFKLPCTFHALCLVLCLSRTAFATNPFVQYAVDFPDPSHVAARNFSSRFNGAEATIVAWAEEMASYGPWSVTYKPVVAPSGDKHDYMSWAPYEWPNCTVVSNKTVLTSEQVWKTCPYVFRDGLVNPDRTTINDFQSFFNLSDAVLYNAIAATFQKTSSVYSQNVVKFIDTWFLNANTSMNPNLNFAQMNRGPTGQLASTPPVLMRPSDLRGFAKIASGILSLRKSENPDWTAALDTQMVAWCNKYIDWLQTAPKAITAAKATNNHGTIFVSQLAALKLIVNDVAGAVNLTQGYFQGHYKGQLAASGDQPQEASRSESRPYHYRNFNIAGMVTNARILAFADPTVNPWAFTANGATIQTSVDFLMATDPAATNETNVTAEIYPNVAAIASAYGDPAGKYVRFLNASGFAYGDDATFLWDQPLPGGDAGGGSPDSESDSGSGSGSQTTAAQSGDGSLSFKVLACLLPSAEP
ncbi:chondroitin AC/alginate lyase [Mycena pura]|uniref:Chondroitin AC/alginate lyase n=1 Tax=Mycena pura TaxID=153505 RepID=A0AAD6Y723_9AGAR|nr:chondroitin AC/alginate lyase [Mycena pura]